MKQLIQDLKTGQTYLEDVPIPAIRPGHVLIKSHSTLVSPGTEKMLVAFGKANYIQKARQQPEKVKQVINKIKSDGLKPTVDAVFRKLNQPLPLGYSNAGEVIGVGAGISSFTVGDRVISNGHHAEYVCIPENLCAAIPENVSYDEACFTVLGAIALQGIRLLEPQLGEIVVVTGLGLIGMLSCQILHANGVKVIGLDIDESRVLMAKGLGINAHNPRSSVKLVKGITNGVGADAVLVTASSSSDQIISQAAQMCRQRGKIVLLGVVGLDLNRADFYEKEISFQVSCSYGPGRYDRQYEEKGLDYPIGFVRWTEKRNFEAVLELIKNGRLQTSNLISQQVNLSQFDKVYTDLDSSIASIINYNTNSDSSSPTIKLIEKSFSSSKGVMSIVGAGNFTNAVVCPLLTEVKAQIKYIVSADGLHATQLAKRYKIPNSSSSYHSVLLDEEVDAIIITTRHNLHASQILNAFEHDKHVFVEKPLCLTREELDLIQKLYVQKNCSLIVGYNRRFAPFIKDMQTVIESGPMNSIMTVNAGDIPQSHWTQDADIGGGRIIGELCHFVDLMIYLHCDNVTEVLMSQGQTQDNVTLILQFQNGSTSSIHYFPNGHKSLSKEKIEIHQYGNSLILDNFKSIKYFGYKKSNKTKTQDKGHKEQFKKYKEMIETGGRPIIAFEDIVHSSKVLFAAIESAQQKQWISID